MEIPKLTNSQYDILMNALYSGAERMLNRKGKRISASDTYISYRAHSKSVRKLNDLDLADGRRLTNKGLKVADALWRRDTRHTTAEDGESRHFPNVVDAVLGVRAFHAREEREEREKFRRALKLWTGITVTHWTGRKRAMTTEIREEFGSGRISYRSGIDFDLDTLIEVGEQIEKLRQGAK